MARDDKATDATVFRRVISNFTSGVVVITTEHEGVPYGMTVSAVSSLSMDPPMLLVCLNTASRTQEAVHSSGRFAVNILSEAQGDMAERFARSSIANKFADVPSRPGRTGVPVLTDTLATIECEVAEAVTGGTHRVFLSTVVHAEATDAAPLTYFRGTFGKFELVQDAATYQRLRQLVLSRELGPGEQLVISDLADRFNLSAAALSYALTRLVTDRLVTRDPDRGYIVTPLDGATAEDAHDAKLAIELGAAELVLDYLSPEQLDEFRRLAANTAKYVRNGRFLDLGAYIAANHAFHLYLIQATGIRALVEAYEQLSLPDLMTRTLTGIHDAPPHLTEDHDLLIDALERSDPDAVKQVISAHDAHAKLTLRVGIQNAGGSI